MEINTYSYKVTCRRWGLTDRFEHTIMDVKTSNLEENSPDKEESGDMPTEYKAMLYLEEHVKYNCFQCGPGTPIISEISLNDQKLYVPDEVAEHCKYFDECMLVIYIKKRQGSITIDIGGSTSFSPNMLETFFDNLKEELRVRPQEIFNSHLNGYFQASLTGGINYDKDGKNLYTKIHRLFTYGLSRIEIADSFDRLKESLPMK